jgi:GGDEF domain-containing protein
VAVKLAQSLRRPFTVAGHELNLGVSVGVGQYPAHGKQADALLRKALAQASGMASMGTGNLAQRTERHGGAAAANDDD